MRFRKRFSAAILAIVMMISSIQIPGGTSYAAEMADSSIESGQNVSVLAEEDTDGAVTAAGDEKPSNDGVITDDGSQTGNDNQSGDDNLTGGDSQTGNDNPEGGDSQAGDDGPAGDDQTGNDDPAGDDQTGDDNTTGDDQMGDDNPADNENYTEDDADAGEISGDDSDEPTLSEDTEETRREEAEIKGAYQFGSAPEQTEDSKSRISAFSVTTYDDSVEDYLYQKLLERTEVVYVGSYDVNMNNKDKIMSNVLNEHPDLYFVQRKYYVVVGMNGYNVSEFDFKYLDGCDDEAFEENVEKALSCVDEEMSDLQKAAVLHDYLSVNVEYDKENLQKDKVPEISFTAYGALVNRIAVCEGYALAYKYLLNKVGIECHMVTSSTMNHAWNMVKLDGKYYHVDVTWDDPTWDIVGRAMHTYFLSSDSNLAGHRDWYVTVGSDVVDYKATDTMYESAFWKKSSAPLLMKGNYCYYVSDSGSLRKASFVNIRDAGTEIVSIGSWPTWEGTGTWQGAYSGLYMIDGRLFYNDPYAIYSISEDGNDKRTEFTAITVDGYIYGSAYCQDKVYYALHKSPNLTGKENVLVAQLTGVSTPEEPEEPEKVDEPIPSIITEEGYNIPNLDLTFKCENYNRVEVDTSTSVYKGSRNGKPTVLMFFDSKQKAPRDFTVETLKNVYSGSGNKLNGVNRYAIDCSDATYEELKQWRIDNDCYYCADYGRAEGYDMLKQYRDAVEEKNDTLNGIVFPIIIYIDKNDMIQYASALDEKTRDEMFDDLRKYCNYEMCHVTWNLNGGIKPAGTYFQEWLYTGYGDESLPKPWRFGYRFEGWYRDMAFTKKLTKIPKGTIADFTLYAKWSLIKAPFGIPNLTQEYTTIDDTKISSTAEGRPKLLMFGRYEDFYYSIEKISNALNEDPEHPLHGVDIYAIDTVNLSKETINLYLNNKEWSDEMMFSYSLDSYNQECMQAYLEKVQIDSDYLRYFYEDTLIFYIDAQNRLQYMSIEGEGILNNVMSNLRTYCNYPTVGAKFYDIKYVMNGGLNNADNPERYHTEMEENIILKDPVRDEYLFDGWYTDETFYDRITEIDVNSACDFTLYAKWKHIYPGYSNYDITFDKVGGGTVSSTAENGRPKLLLFAGERCGFTPRVVEGIKNNAEWFKGVDIVIAVATQTTTDIANEFITDLKEQSGCDMISFALDNNGNNDNWAWAYVRLALPSFVTTYISPLMVFIDADNKVRNVIGSSDPKKLLEELNQYCNYGAYYIEYEMYGGVNDSRNPEVYFEDSETIVLKEPALAGCTFEGWYRDPEYKRPVTEIPTGSKANCKLYAKWKEGSTSHDNLTQEYTALDDTTITSTASGKPKVMIFYKYGSSYKQITTNTIKNISGELLNNSDSFLHDVDIYAIGMDGATKENAEELKNKYGGGCDEIIYAYDKDADNNEKAEAYRAAGGQSGSFKNLVIAYIDADDHLQYVTELKTWGDKAPNAADILANLRKYCNYPIYYKITYELDGGTNSKDNPDEYNCKDEVVLSAPNKDRCIFEGWYLDTEFSEKVTEIHRGDTGDITLYAKWKEAYVITYELDGGMNNIDNPDRYASDGETIILKNPTKEGYRFRGWYSDAEFNDSVSEIPAGSNGDITLYAKWEENPGLVVDNKNFSYTAIDGTAHSSTAKDRPKLLIFYNYLEQDSKDTIKDVAGIIDDLDGVDIYAIDVEMSTRISVGRFKDSYGCDGITFMYDESYMNYYSMQQYLIAAGLSPTSNTPVICYIDADNILQWVTCAQRETGEGILDNLQKYCEWTGAEKGTYRITYVLDGGTNNISNPATYTSETETITLKDAVKEGYTFEGWYKDAGFTESKKVTEIVKGSTGDIMLYAKWKENSEEPPVEPGTYRITYVLNDGTNSSENPATYTSETETITLKPATREGYTFEGWYKDAEFTESEKVTEIVTGSEGDITLYAKWKENPLPQGTYRIRYELDGGINSSENPLTYTSETETITLKDATREGYTFEGWYKDAEFTESGKVTEIVQGSTGDITLYAKWKAAAIDTEEIRSGLYIRFMDYNSFDAGSSEPCYKYTGTAIKPVVEVYNNGTLLVSGTDYTISYKNNTKVGPASLSVKGKGSFSGASNAVSFMIVKADIDTDTVHPEEMTVIAGTKVAPVIINSTKNLTAKDYRLEGTGLDNGKYMQTTAEGSPNILTVTGTGSYEGSFTIAVNVIAKGDAKKLAVTVDSKFKPVYNGSTIDLNALFASPYSNGGSIKVTDSKDKTKVLEKGRDFSVVCTSSLKDAGTVKFTVTGMGLYAGSVSKTFKISPLKVTESSKFGITFDDKDYEYKASGTTVDGLKVKYLGDTPLTYDDIELTEGRDYKVSYSNNKNVTTSKNAQVKITFLGNYKGSKAAAKDFTIVSAKMRADGDSHNTEVVVPDKVYGKAGKAYKSVPIVTVGGETIKASNYTVSYAWATETDVKNGVDYAPDNNVKITLGESDNYAKVRVTITPKGTSYALAYGVTSIEGEYYVRKAGSAKDLSKAKVTFSNKKGDSLKALEYNGKAYYTPEGNDPKYGSAPDDANAVYVSVTVNGEPVDAGLYDVVWTNSTAKGKATVVITGKGSLAVGSKNQTISIKAMALKGKSFNTFIAKTADSLKNMFFKK